MNAATKERRLQHDSHIRTDWLPMGLTRKQAQEFEAELQSRLADAGAFGGHQTRNWRDQDYVAVTVPGSWKQTHGRGHTVKVRGCTQFRQEARVLGREIADEHGLRWANLADPRKLDMPMHEIDTRLDRARDEGKIVLVYCGSSAYVRGIPGQVYRDDNGLLVVPIGQREIALATITKVED